MPPLWHALAEAEVLGRLDADGEGLTSADAQRRSERFGPNRLPEASGPSPLVPLLRQLSSPLRWALLLSAAVAILLGQLEDGLVVLAVVVLNGVPPVDRRLLRHRDPARDVTTRDP